jgi:nucleotide-binding universal stress UspA family protein
MPDRLIRRILAPVELSENSPPDLSYAIGLAGQMRAEMILLAVIDNAATVTLIGTHRAATATPGETLNAALVEDAKKILQPIVDTAAERGVLAHGHATVSQDVSEQILKEAMVQQVDLIVLRPRARSRFLAKLMGSTVGDILAAAPCPVLVGQA